MLWYYPTYDRIQFTSLDTRSAFVFTCYFGTKTILSCSRFEDDSSPHISGSSSLIRIKLTFVLFKHVTLMWINYLETWPHSDNTSCYYISNDKKVLFHCLCSTLSIVSGLPVEQFGHCPKAREGPALGCNYCWNTTDPNGRILRRKTKYHCPDCQANLCIVPCFQVPML